MSIVDRIGSALIVAAFLTLFPGVPILFVLQHRREK